MVNISKHCCRTCHGRNEKLLSEQEGVAGRDFFLVDFIYPARKCHDVGSVSSPKGIGDRYQEAHIIQVPIRWERIWERERERLRSHSKASMLEITNRLLSQTSPKKTSCSLIFAGSVSLQERHLKSSYIPILSGFFGKLPKIALLKLHQFRQCRF